MGLINGVVAARVQAIRFSIVGLFRCRSLAGRSLFSRLLHIAGELIGGVIIFWLMIDMKVCSTMPYHTSAQSRLYQNFCVNMTWTYRLPNQNPPDALSKREGILGRSQDVP